MTSYQENKCRHFHRRKRKTIRREIILIQFVALTYTFVRAFSPPFVAKISLIKTSENCHISGLNPVIPRTQVTRHSDIFISKKSVRSDIENENDIGHNDEDEVEQPPSYDYFDDDKIPLTGSQVEQLTVTQLKQQLRLRGGKVSGKKSELIQRLKGILFIPEENGFTDPSIIEPDLVDMDTPLQSNDSKKAREFAEANGKKLIDVSAYLDEEDVGKETKTSINSKTEDEISNDSDSEEESTNPETWGEEARIVEDYEGRSVVVDGLSRTVIEFRGYNNTKVQAYVVASRDSLKAYLSGGNRTSLSPEAQVKEIQTAREKASKGPIKFDDIQGVDEGDEEGHYTNVVEREYGDWGKYSLTGAQLSAQEVQGVLFLSDVYGPFNEDTKMLADKIAFECQPLVVMVPDLFRGNPWEEDKNNPGFNKNNESYEDWRATHSDQRASVDIRAAAASLREQYGVSSVSVFGTCYGGGRALEAAAGWYPNNIMEDCGGRPGPPPVDPAACIAWYPTRYDCNALFGDTKVQDLDNSKKSKVAIMAVFAENDGIPGARPEDAAELKGLLESNENVKDHMVKVFPGVGHGFAHIGISNDPEDEDKFIDGEFGGSGTPFGSGDAEVACLLSTAFLETYSRVFLPTLGPCIKDDTDESWSELEMKDLSSSKRNMREELDDALDSHEDVEIDMNRFHPDDFKSPIGDLEDMDDNNMMESINATPYGFSPEDDFETFMQKIKDAAIRGDVDYTPGFGDIPLDDTEDAYW